MRKFYFILMLLGLSPAIANLLAPSVGPNIRLGDDPDALPAGFGKNQAEPHVTRSIVDPDLVLATFQEGRYSDGGAVSNGYAVSRDGGFNWTRALNPNLTLASGGPYYRATDPVAGISLEGTLYLNSLVSVDASFNLGRLVIQRSDDFGQSWTDPITIYNGSNFSAINRIFPDKNWMVVNDIQGTPNAGRIIATWTNFRTIINPGNDISDYVIMSSYSDDAGDSWSVPEFVTPPQQPDYSRLQYQGSQPVFLPQGDLAIVFHNFNGTRLEVKYSPDGGESYPYPVDPLHSNYFLYDAPNMRDGSFLPSVDAASETGDLYIAYASKINALDNYGHIYFVRSRRTSSEIPANSAPDWDFTSPIIISGLTPFRVACTPTIAVSPDGMQVSVFFYDNRNGSGENDSGDFYAVQSNDGGFNWSAAYRISDTTFPLNRATQTSRGYMLGDYYGFAAPQGPDQAGIAVWVGTPLETADPWSSRLAGMGADVYKSWLQANLPYADRMDSEDDYIGDPDRDGVPNFLEYVTGQSPFMADDPQAFEEGPTHLLINPQTDPATQLEIAAASGHWPSQQQILTAVANVTTHGEGFWDAFSWPTGAGIQQLQFTINNEESWYLMDSGSPAQWVTPVVGNWVWSPWLGYIETTHSPWLFHEQLGWVYDLRGALYSSSLDTYLFVSPQYHPWIYTSDDSFLYLSEVQPWVYQQNTDNWIRMY